MADNLEELRKRARQAAVEADEELQQELTALHRMTVRDLEALKPRLSTDEATFNSLVKACEQATRDNMSIAEFTTRLKTLGTNVLAIARHASTMLPL
jgi:hypothetical protein